jgi:hypothetical protein
MPPAKQIVAEIQQLLAGPGGALWLSGGPGPGLDGTTWSRMTTELQGPVANPAASPRRATHPWQVSN